MFGQILDVLEDIWIQLALDDIEEANRIIDEVPKSHLFKLRYEKSVGKVEWEVALKYWIIKKRKEKKKYLMESW